MVLVGPAGAGKSTYAAGYRPQAVLSRDALRGVIAGDESDQLPATTAAAEALLFRVPLATCLARNAARSRRVPEGVLRAEHAAAAAVTPVQLAAEGWQRVVVVDERGQVLEEAAGTEPGR